MKLKDDSSRNLKFRFVTILQLNASTVDIGIPLWPSFSSGVGHSPINMQPQAGLLKKYDNVLASGLSSEIVIEQEAQSL
jgi:hypothetical protein